MATLSYEKRQKITTQALAEISFARQAKLPKIT